jgi:hypothetical protein
MIYTYQMKIFNMKLLFVLLTFFFINIYNQDARGESLRGDLGFQTEKKHSESLKDNTELRSNFFLLCDSLIKRIDNRESKIAYFIDSYAVRSLCVAYDMTGKKEYLDACISWSHRMMEHQKRMIPTNAYYMNYHRKPGEDHGDWYIADASTIGMAVLTTAVRCNKAEKEQMLKSVEDFAAMVMQNYIRTSGGVCNGAWPKSENEWWCSSSLFGSLAFMLYDKTGDKKYLETGLKIIDWLNKEDLNNTIPYPLSHQGPSMPMYFLEAYTAGWPYISKNGERKKTSEAKVEWILDWIKTQQQTPFSERKWSPAEWWGSKFGGLPFHQYIFSKYLPEGVNLISQGDQELKRLTELSISQNLFRQAQMPMFLIFSYAERVSPGRIYRMN